MAAYFKDPHLKLSWDEFCSWQAYFELEPPEQADNWRTALLAERITNMAGKSVKKPVKLDAFMPKKPKKPQTAEEQKAFLRGLANG